MNVSVLVPSLNRIGQLTNCLDGLAKQSLLPFEVIVTWQQADTATRDAALAYRAPFPIKVLHCESGGVVPAENVALVAATGDLVALMDDDAVPPPDWLERLVRFFNDPTVGAAGGPIDNTRSDGTPFPRSEKYPTARLTWYGKLYGNGHDLPIEWRSREPIVVHHLAGANMIFRRGLVTGFEMGLKKYWQQFELEACSQIRRRGLKIIYDFGAVVNHYPTTNTAYVAGRDGDLTVKVYNAAYNYAFVLAKHSVWPLRPVRLMFLLLVGSIQVPGLIGSIRAWRRYGGLRREIGILWRTWSNVIHGWIAGRLRG